MEPRPGDVWLRTLADLLGLDAAERNRLRTALAFQAFPQESARSWLMKGLYAEARSIPRLLRLEVIERDGETCQYCTKPTTGIRELVIDHVVPVALGGMAVASNLVVACDICNACKGSQRAFRCQYCRRWTFKVARPPYVRPENMCGCQHRRRKAREANRRCALMLDVWQNRLDELDEERLEAGANDGATPATGGPCETTR